MSSSGSSILRSKRTSVNILVSEEKKKMKKITTLSTKRLVSMNILFEKKKKNTKKKIINKEEEHEENHFDRLPEDIVLLIFNSVADLKSLYQCSLVSRYFASVISHVQTITVTLPATEPPSMDSCQSLFDLLPETSYLEPDQFPAYLDSLSLQHLMNLPLLLKKFTKLESIYLEFSNNKQLSSNSSSSIMWKAKTGSSSSLILDKFVALLPASVHKTTKSTGYDEYDQEVQQVSQNSDWKTPYNDCFRLSLGRYVEWLCLICIITKSHSSLQSVTITDSEKQEKLVMKDEQLVNLRSLLHEGNQGAIELGSIILDAQIPLLHLPLSGYTMKDVNLLIVKESGEDDDILGLDFENHENVFGEALKEISKNHRHLIS